jgi:hypothetical protein
MYNDNNKVILYIEMKPLGVCAIKVLNYKTNIQWRMHFELIINL